MVHPDLFGKFPEQRAINENSLQILSAHLESLQRQTTAQSSPSTLPFYLRNKDKSKPFRLVKVPMHVHRETKGFVVGILKLCEVERENIEKVEKISSAPTSPKRTLSEFYPSRNVKYTVDDDNDDEFEMFQFKVRRAREDESLEKFIRKNIDLAMVRTKSLDELKEEVQRLKVELIRKLQIVEINYNCGWNFEHFRGCLKSLEKLHDLNSEDMTNLRNKKIIFSQFTGVSLDGDIHFFTGDVQNNWMEVMFLNSTNSSMN
jgi:Domain of unknown function (DUF4461)/Domain of unknown function (DUF4460)